MANLELSHLRKVQTMGAEKLAALKLTSIMSSFETIREEAFTHTIQEK